MDSTTYQRLRQLLAAGDGDAARALIPEAQRRADHALLGEALLTTTLGPLAVTPSAAGWRRLLEQLDADPSLTDDPARVEALNTALSVWPDALRWAPKRWLAAAFGPAAGPTHRLRLTRRLNLSCFDADAPDRLSLRPYEAASGRWSWALAELATCPALRDVSIIEGVPDGRGPGGYANGLTCLMRASSLRGVRALELRDLPAERLIDALRWLTGLPLEHLTLRLRAPVRRDDWRRHPENTEPGLPCPRLRSLTFEAIGDWTPADLAPLTRALLRSPLLERLEAVALLARPFPPSFNASALLDATLAPTLRHAALRVDARGAQLLIEHADALDGLERLTLLPIHDDVAWPTQLKGARLGGHIDVGLRTAGAPVITPFAEALALEAGRPAPEANDVPEVDPEAALIRCLQRTPSLASWQELLRWRDRHPERFQSPADLDAWSSHLAGWPDALRVADSARLGAALTAEDADQVWLRLARHVDLGSGRFELGALEAARGPGRRHGLRFSGEPPGYAWRRLHARLTRCEALAHVTHLTDYPCRDDPAPPDAPPSELRSLLESPVFERLEEVSLGLLPAGSTPQLLSTLGRWPLRGLRVHARWDASRADADAHAMARGLAALDHPSLRRLEVFQIQRLSTPAFAGLLESVMLDRLEILAWIDACGTPPELLDALLQRRLRALRRLTLCVGSEGARQLAEGAPRLGHLEALTLLPDGPPGAAPVAPWRALAEALARQSVALEVPGALVARIEGGA